MTPTISASSLSQAFTSDRAAFVGYLMAGYPDRSGSLEAMRTLAAASADVIELGVPYSDPLADGPVIRDAAAAAFRAAKRGFGLGEAIDLAGEFNFASPGHKPPVVIMSYLNPLLRMGMADAAAAMRGAGVAGVIVPDLPPDMAEEWLSVSDGLDTVFLVAPTSTSERLRVVAERSRGFVYCVSTNGITGEREQMNSELDDLIARVRASTSLPVAVGFGVSTPEQAGRIARHADGVIVGSALVRRQADVGDLSVFAASLAEAVHGAR